MRKSEILEKMVTLQGEYIDLLKEEIDRLRVQLAALRGEARKLAENLKAKQEDN